MITLVRKVWNGREQYTFEHGDEPLRGEDNRHAVRAPITAAQAMLGIEACAALFETGRLNNNQTGE